MDLGSSPHLDFPWGYNRNSNSYSFNIPYRPPNQMTTPDFLATLQSNYDNGMKLIKAKNHDYAKGSDPFSNFRMSELIGVPVHQAILMRMCDKMARISNLWGKEAQVSDESIEDSILDLCNYGNILLAYRKDSRGN